MMKFLTKQTARIAMHIFIFVYIVQALTLIYKVDTQAAGKTYTVTSLNSVTEKTSPEEIANIVNKALVYAKEKGYSTVKLPKGDYTISHKITIQMQSGVTLDLNKSILRMEPHDQEFAALVTFNCVDAALINGTLIGDRYQHDYNTIKGTHEWDNGIEFWRGDNCVIKNVTIKDFAGAGITTYKGTNLSKNTTGITQGNLVVGNINAKGKTNTKKGTIRTRNMIQITNLGGEFEIGMDRGYSAYPHITSKNYITYFYNKNKKFIKSVSCEQYKKVKIPKGARYAHFVFDQESVPKTSYNNNEKTCAFITNLKPADGLVISNCNIKNNRTLGMAICGGKNMIIEKTVFDGNGGQEPGYAIDLEDGWEYMQNNTIRNCTFKNNKAGDFVSCAGDNTKLESNTFTNIVYFWPRSTNIKVINNTFNNCPYIVNLQYGESSKKVVIKGNTYKNVRIRYGEYGKLRPTKETYYDCWINELGKSVTIMNSTLKNSGDNEKSYIGSFKNCTFSKGKCKLIDATLTNCVIKNKVLDTSGTIRMNKCKVSNSTLLINGPGVNRVTINRNKFTNTKIDIPNYPHDVKLTLSNSTCTMTKSCKKSLLDYEAGEKKVITLKNNKITNLSKTPVINFYNKCWSLPNTKLSLTGNKISTKKTPYLIKCGDLYSGKATIILRNNKINCKKIMEEKYKKSAFYKVSIR